MPKPKTDAASKRGRGRPRVADPRVPMPITVNASEHATYQRYRRLMDVSLSEWVRRACRLQIERQDAEIEAQKKETDT